jgi:hypothetical protein
MVETSENTNVFLLESLYRDPGNELNQFINLTLFICVKFQEAKT